MSWYWSVTFAAITRAPDVQLLQPALKVLVLRWSHCLLAKGLRKSLIGYKKSLVLHDGRSLPNGVCNLILRHRQIRSLRLRDGISV